MTVVTAASLLMAWLALPLTAGTVGLWLFDEPTGLYPSSILDDASGHGNILVLGRGARMAEGRFGRALEVCDPIPLNIRRPDTPFDEESQGLVLFGLRPLPVPAGRTQQPLHWGNALFAALATSGEKHLRSPGFPNVSRTALNLGAGPGSAGDWTVEFWLQPAAGARQEGTVYEIGSGPRGENDRITRLSWQPASSRFLLYQGAARPALEIPSRSLVAGTWFHLAFTYSAGERQLRHYVDGVLQTLPEKLALKPLETGDEAYLSIGRDGRFGSPLAGRLDELRVSDEVVYRAPFPPPGSFSLVHSGRLPPVRLAAGPPLLFDPSRSGPLPLGSRKHLFLDDALLAESAGVTFVPNPPVRQEKVFDDLPGHLSLVEDETGLLRIYYRAKQDALGVVTSRDGVHWDQPGSREIALAAPVGLGNVFLDPNAPPEQRWKYFSGIRRRSMYIFHSPDGWKFRQHETAALPFAAGSQSIVYYDDQRQVYSSHHRSDYGMMASGRTRRRFLLAETRDLLSPWSFEAMTPEKTLEAAKRERLKASRLDPWYTDNGPLSPPGLGAELPTVIANDEALDPPGTDIYTTKVMKYSGAPDAYLAFPAVYFHYDSDGPPTRTTLGARERKLGSGVVEVQLAVSRDGLRWKRYPRPAYIPINSNGADAIHMMFLTHGLVRRGNEIWQYAGGHAGNGINYHSAYVRQPNSPLWRFLQRVDGFVAAEASYTGGTMKTRPLVFEGSRLRLNIDTGAVGYAQVGFLDESGRPVPGYSVEDCVYINGDFLDKTVEWLGKGTDVAALAGRTVQLVFRMRGARLFALQFTP